MRRGPPRFQGGRTRAFCRDLCRLSYTGDVNCVTDLWVDRVNGLLIRFPEPLTAEGRLDTLATQAVAGAAEISTAIPLSTLFIMASPVIKASSGFWFRLLACHLKKTQRHFDMLVRGRQNRQTRKICGLFELFFSTSLAPHLVGAFGLLSLCPNSTRRPPHAAKAAKEPLRSNAVRCIDVGSRDMRRSLRNLF